MTETQTVKYVIEPTIQLGTWNVVCDRGPVMEILHSGSALDCLGWCADRGRKVGPRVFVVEEQ